MLIEDIQKCQCGSLTVYWENGTNTSMTQETFDKKFPETSSEPTLNTACNCNHCVNHWGIDLCGCGSGEPVGNCDGIYEDCQEGNASQELFINKKFVGWVS